MRVLDQHRALPGRIPTDLLAPPGLDELMARDVPLPTALVLELLDVDDLGPPQRRRLALPEDTRMALALHAWAEIDRLHELPSSLVARHLAFWSRHRKLGNSAARLLVAARALNALDGEAPAPPADVRPRQRLSEAYELLGVAPAERRIDRPVEETLTKGSLRGPLLAALTTLVRVPYQRTRNVLRPLKVAIVSAGGLGIVPLVATNVLQVLVIMPTPVRVALGVICLIAGGLFAMSSATATLRITVAIAVGLLVWCYAVLLLTVSVAQDTVSRWGASGAALLDGDVGSRMVEILPAAATYAGLLFVLAMWVLRRPETPA